MNEENHPPCKHCGHPGLSHDEEFGNCDRLGMTETGWSICDCPGYEELDPTPPESEYPHVWRDKVTGHVCAILDRRPMEQWHAPDEMHFYAYLPDQQVRAQFSRWYDAEWWIGTQPMPKASK